MEMKYVLLISMLIIIMKGIYDNDGGNDGSNDWLSCDGHVNQKDDSLNSIIFTVPTVRYFIQNNTRCKDSGNIKPVK